MTTLDTNLEIKSWDEKAYRELPDGRKYTRTDVVLAGTGPVEIDGSRTEITEASFEAVMYYRPDGSSTYLTLMTLIGTLGDRHGSLVLAGEGHYDGAFARGESRVIDATGDLVGVTGTATSVSTHADYPFMPITLTYDIA
jgi:Protein of unknown function (DUF3224)